MIDKKNETRGNSGVSRGVSILELKGLDLNLQDEDLVPSQGLELGMQEWKS